MYRAETFAANSWFARVAATLEVWLIVILFFVHAGGRPPATNEAHYLTRSKHFWNPNWCSNDLFLNSFESQPAFQSIFGWPSLFVPLEAVAWSGRLAGWSLIAWGWVRLSRALGLRPGWALLSAAVSLLLWDHFHMAGEWMVGGIEAKVPSYGFVLLALAEFVRARWGNALLLLAVATMFHPLVGGWSTLAATTVWALDDRRGSIVALLPKLSLAAIISLIGIVPALWLDAGADVDTIRVARHIYVSLRLDHHLLMRRFPAMHLLRHFGLLAVWLACWKPWSLGAGQRTRGEQRLQQFVAACVGIAVLGACVENITWKNWIYRSQSMRYYWYRMSDTMLATGTSFLLVRWLQSAVAAPAGWNDNAGRRRWWGDRLCGFLILIVGLNTGVAYFARQLDSRPTADQQGRREAAGAVVEYRDWLDVCRWCEEETATEALFLTPTYIQTFKWYAGRAEFATWKDIPQDSRAIVEWWRRRRAIRELGCYGTQPPNDTTLRAWVAEHPVDYCVVPRRQQGYAWLAPIVYENGSYQVFRLRE